MKKKGFFPKKEKKVYSPSTMSIYIAVSSFWTLSCLQKAVPSDTDTWNAFLPRDVLMVSSAKWNHSMQHTSLKNDEKASPSCDSNSLHFSTFSNRVVSAEGLRWTGWHSSRMEQMMMGYHFGLTDVCLWQSECQSLSVTRYVILLQECTAICSNVSFFFMQCLIIRL